MKITITDHLGQTVKYKIGEPDGCFKDIHGSKKIFNVFPFDWEKYTWADDKNYILSSIREGFDNHFASRSGKTVGYYKQMSDTLRQECTINVLREMDGLPIERTSLTVSK